MSHGHFWIGERYVGWILNYIDIIEISQHVQYLSEVSPSVLHNMRNSNLFHTIRVRLVGRVQCASCIHLIAKLSAEKSNSNWEYVCISSLHSLQQSKIKAPFRHEWSERVSCWVRRVYWIFVSLYTYGKHKLPRPTIFHVSSNGCSLVNTYRAECFLSFNFVGSN